MNHSKEEMAANKMKKHILFYLVIIALLNGVLSACTVDRPSASKIDAMSIAALPTYMPIEVSSWQDDYAELLRKSDSEKFYLCDIDENGTLELLVGGVLADWSKYQEYDVYTYKNNAIVHIGVISTLSSGSLWLDNNRGILGYAYGAGSGGTYRYYIDNDELCYDDEVYGYNYTLSGEQTEWFRDADGNKKILSEETEQEFQVLWGNNITLEGYEINESSIKEVIYSNGSPHAL